MRDLESANLAIEKPKQERLLALCTVSSIAISRTRRANRESRKSFAISAVRERYQEGLRLANHAGSTKERKEGLDG